MKVLNLLSLFAVTTALADPIKVAVIDTGMDPVSASRINLCKDGHKDFSGRGIKDTHGHGTHIAGIITRNAGMNDKYCIVVVKYYDERASGYENLENLISSVNYAVDEGVKFINISGGGPEGSSSEARAIKRALDAGIIIVAAAGNNGLRLSTGTIYETITGRKLSGDYYPAMYDSRIYVVGNLQKNLEPNLSSNHGPLVRYWEVGTSVEAESLGGRTEFLTGTSQAAAIKTGKLVKDMITR